MKLLIKYPTRSRPEQFARAVEAYTRLSTHDDVQMCLVLDDDDETMMPHVDHLREEGALISMGRSTGKIHAVNRDVSALCNDWDILLLASDDMIPQEEGYDSRIVEDMARWFSDTDGVLFYYDGHTPLNTLIVTGRKYYERFGYLYHPSYKSLWCDNEFMMVADLHGRQVFIRRTIIRHEHYSNGYGKPDGLMVNTERWYKQDERNFRKRLGEGFPR